MSSTKTWRDSATLILAACSKNVKDTISTSNHNYKLLCLERHQKSTFMPNVYVFPGGTVDSADTDLKWHNLFGKFGYSKSSFTSLFSQASTRPDIFKQGPNELPKEISLRITAIRETFEECGILICKRANLKDNFSNWSQHLQFSEKDREQWQEKVHNNASEFFTLCENFECYPDLWSIYEWSNWMTPTALSGKRFDTAFFLACLPNTPNATYDSTEMEDIQWYTPEQLLSKKCVSKLAHPQQYEVQGIEKFKNIDDLLNAAIKRNKAGAEFMLPVKLQLADGSAYILPGDSMYPKEVNRAENQIIDRQHMTIIECRQASPKKNRYELSNSGDKALIQSVENV